MAGFILWLTYGIGWEDFSWSSFNTFLALSSVVAVLGVMGLYLNRIGYLHRNRHIPWFGNPARAIPLNVNGKPAGNIFMRSVRFALNANTAVEAEPSDRYIHLNGINMSERELYYALLDMHRTRDASRAYWRSQGYTDHQWQALVVAAITIGLIVGMDGRGHHKVATTHLDVWTGMRKL